jgi:hypothetical protein
MVNDCVRHLKILMRHLLILCVDFQGTLQANTTADDFNQTLPMNIAQALFINPVNLSNLHQSWFIERNNQLSTINVLTEIYLEYLQINTNYVCTCLLFETCHQ